MWKPPSDFNKKANNMNCLQKGLQMKKKDDELKEKNRQIKNTRESQKKEIQDSIKDTILDPDFEFDEDKVEELILGRTIRNDFCMHCYPLLEGSKASLNCKVCRKIKENYSTKMRSTVEEFVEICKTEPLNKRFLYWLYCASLSPKEYCDQS